MTWLIIIAVIVLLILAYIVIYNGLVRVKTYVDEAWSQIDVQLKRRNDLIPNLINTVKGAANYEKSTLTAVVEQRTALNQIPDSQHEEKMAASNALTSSLRTLFAVSENYPELRANTQFSELTEELTNTENKIAYARQLYNDCVQKYDMKIKTFPANIVASIHHYKEIAYLSTPEAEKDVPKVEFDF